MNPKRIVFVVPPVSLKEIYGGLAKVGAVSPPLNLLLLAAIVREKGYVPAIIDCPAQGLGYVDVLEGLQAINPKFVGITSMTPHIMQASKLAKTIKKELPETVVLLGGAHISAVPEETMHRFPDIDIGAIGEADYSLPELLDALNSGKRASSVKGFISRENGTLVNTGQSREKIELDELPFYAWDILEGFPQAYKTSLFATHRTPATPLITSRGCPGKCTFCYSGCHETLATYSAEYTVKMLKHLKSTYGIKEFLLFDDNFVMYRKNLLKLLNMLIDEKVGMTWSCNSRIDMVNEEVLNLMARAGCWQISYGIETGNQKIMDSLEKNITKEKVRETIALSRKAGIRTVGYFMIGHFGETQETIDDTIQFAREICLDDFRMSYFTPLPGTKASLVAGQYGEFDNNWEKMNLFSPVFFPKGITREQLTYSQKRAIRKFFFRPRAVWSYLKMVKNPVVALRGAYMLGQYIFNKG
jgi:radical SAM superfamily enzyme YgiQ (UPF0313 family)